MSSCGYLAVEALYAAGRHSRPFWSLATIPGVLDIYWSQANTLVPSKKHLSRKLFELFNLNAMCPS